MATYLCPMCVRRYQAAQFRIHDRNGEPFEAPRPPLWRQLRRSDRDEDERLANLDALARGLHPRCPQGHPMPRSFLERPTLVIGLIGAAAVSKSTYLGVLFHELTHSQPFAALGLNFFIDSYCENDQRIYASLLADNRAPLITQVPETVRGYGCWCCRCATRTVVTTTRSSSTPFTRPNPQRARPAGGPAQPVPGCDGRGDGVLHPGRPGPGPDGPGGVPVAAGHRGGESTDYGPGAT